MRTLTTLAPSLLLALLAGAGATRADDCVRLVEPYGPVTFPRGKHTVTFQAPVAAGAQWFLDVERVGAPTGQVLLNGQVVVRLVDLVGPANELVRVPVQLGATNTLRVEILGAKTTLRAHVRGVVPAAAVGPGVGRRAAQLTLFESAFPGRLPADRRTTQVSLPTTHGIFFLGLCNGPPPAITGALLWNDRPVLGLVPILPGGGSARGPVRVNGTNWLETSVLGLPGSAVAVTLDGWVVDEVAPTAQWTTPAPGALLLPDDALVLEAQDALSGVDTISFSLNGTDVTTAFTRTAAGAQTTLSALPVSALLADNTLTAVVRDRACGETTATVTFRVGVADVTPPTLAQPPDLVVEQQEPAGSVVTYAAPQATDDTDPSPTVTCLPASGSLFGPGATTVTCTATDAAGNATQVTFVVSVRDTTPPALDQPSDLVVEQTSPAGAVVAYAAPAATDAADPAPNVVCAPAAGSVFPGGATTVTCTATDAAGNATQVTFVVTVRDSTPPALEQPADLVVEQTSPAGAVVAYAAPTATDAADPAPGVVCAPASGSVFPGGATTVTCTATDAAGNATQVTFVVTVRDTTPPALEQPADLVVEQTSPAGAVVAYAAPAVTDAVDPAATVACAPASGSVFAAGTTAVICTATDAAGNASLVTFNVTVADTVAPQVVLEPPAGAVLAAQDVVLRAQWTDAGSGADAQSFAATLDGQDASALFVRADSQASATVDLGPGEHTLEVALSDLAGNERVERSHFVVQAVAAEIHHLELTVGPSPRGVAPDETPLLELATEARTLDGSGNDLGNPDEGKAGARLQRALLGADYADGVSAPAGARRPSARRVSNAVHAQSGSVPNGRRATDLLWMWAQFLDHDLSLTRAHDPRESFPIPVGADDPFDPAWTGAVELPFSRSRYEASSSPREQTNELSAWIDASMIYGSDPARAAALRTNDGTGRLRTSAGELLPRNTGALDNLPTAHDPSFFVAGDVRANQNVPLLAFHTLFVREHNRVADLLRARFPQATDEELYQGARRIVAAELQAITYQEFLPALLGPDALAPYTGYRAELDVGIENAFAHAAFRIGHSLLSPGLLRLDPQGDSIAEGSLAVRDAFFAPARLTEGGGIEPLLRGAARQLAQELDPLVVDDVRNYLFGQPGQGGLDLAAIDLQRGRDHGLPGYNEARRQLGLAPRASFAQISADPRIAAKLASVFATVEDVDLLTGGLCEDHVPGALVGELFFTLLRRQLELLRDGDRFFYENAFSGAALDVLARTRLADVIRRNTTIGSDGTALQDDAFLGPLLPFTENDFTVRAVSESGETVISFTGVVQVAASDGKPPLDGLVFELTAGDQGRVTFPGLAFFQTLGPLVITARTVAIDPGDPEVSGSLALTVGLDAPVVFPSLPATVAVGDELTVQGVSFVGQVVELVIDGQLVATAIAGPGGSFTLSARLAPGAHQVLVRSTDPATGLVVHSGASTVEQAAPPAVALDVTPPTMAIAVGQALPLGVTKRFADQTTSDVTTLATYASSDPSVATVSAGGVVTAVAVGAATISVGFDGFTVDVPVTVGVPVLVETSPTHAEQGVAVTRETVLRFSAPVDATTVTADAIRAEFAGATLPGVLHVSNDRRTVTLFYASALPTSARVRVTVSGDLLKDDHGNGIDVDRDGAPGGTTRIDFDTLTITIVPGTVAYGRVFSSRLAYAGDQYSPITPDYEGGGEPGEGEVTSVNVPLSGARISVVGAEDTLFTFTDELGSFRLDPSPAGTFFVHVEVLDPERALRYPDIGKPWTTIAGEETGVGDIYLPIIADDVMQPVSDTEDTTVGFTDEITLQFPHLVGTQLTVPAGSLYSTDGSGEEKKVGIAPVPPDRLPAPLPDGLDFPVVFTIQTAGGDNFDVPAAVRFPNVRGLPPGAKSALWSFNHDTGEWEVIGSMTVSADGLWVETDPGVGVLAPGWHGEGSGAQGEGAETTEPPPPDVDDEPVPEAPLESTLGDEDCVAQCKEPDCGSVLLHSGEERLDRVDVVIPGRGDLSFVMRRRYRSRLDYDGPLGRACRTCPGVVAPPC